MTAVDPTVPDERGVSTALTSREGQQGLALASSILGDEEIHRVWRIAKALASSGMFKGAENQALTENQAFAKILIGRDLGLSSAQSLQALHIVRGNIQVAGKQLLAWIKASDQYDYEVVERTAEKGAIRFHGKSKRTGEWEQLEPLIEFTIEEAKAADLVKAQSGWAKWPANMCLWRCASIGANLLCPDLLGGTPVYTEADSFEDRSVGAGEGDGSEPGWEHSGLSINQVTLVERVIERADEAGYAGLGSGARGPIQMKLSGQPPSYVEAWLAWADGELAKAAAPVASAVEEPVQEGGES